MRVRAGKIILAFLIVASILAIASIGYISDENDRDILNPYDTSASADASGFFSSISPKFWLYRLYSLDLSEFRLPFLGNIGGGKKTAIVRLPEFETDQAENESFSIIATPIPDNDGSVQTTVREYPVLPFPPFWNSKRVLVAMANSADERKELYVILSVNGKNISYVPVEIDPKETYTVQFIIDNPEGVRLSVYSFVAYRTGVETFGAEANPTGNPIGGGIGYTDSISKSNPNVKFVVATKEQLLIAAQRAKSGDIIYVDEHATIDLTGIYGGVTIPAGVTLASNRGRGLSSGGLIRQDRSEMDPDDVGWQSAIRAGGEGVRITGLRIEGPDKGTERIYAQGLPLKTGILSPYADIEVDNCEIFGWSYAGIALMDTGTEPAGHFHHNYIHHCQSSGYGYGVVFTHAVGLVEANLFDYTRHCVACAGHPGDGYEARYNVIMDTQTGHNFDMHADPEKSGAAGTYLEIHHNTFYSTNDFSVAVRAVPIEGAYISHNWFLNADFAPVAQKGGVAGHMYMNRNIIGPGKILSESGPIKMVEKD
jgi:hypothetical protein